MFLATAGAAHATGSTPPWEPDPQSVGTISFYNASGTRITTGSIDDAPIAAYAVASTTIRGGDGRALLITAQPNPNTSTGAYNKDFLTGLTKFPVTSGPTAIRNMTTPVVTGSSGDLTLDDFIQEFPNTDPTGIGCAYSGTPAGCTNTAYQNLYQLRIESANTGGVLTTKYATADVLVSGTTWTQVYPSGPVATPPTISGKVAVGSKVTCKEAPAAGATITYSWHVSGKKVASGASYTIPGSAYKKKLTCTAAVKAGGSTSTATSKASTVALGAPLKATKKPKISGAAKVGKTVKVSHGSWSPKASGYSYQWFAGSKAIKHATKSSLKLKKPQKGKKVTCRVTAHRTGYASGKATSKGIKVT
jgi:hypothetical protein